MLHLFHRLWAVLGLNVPWFVRNLPKSSKKYLFLDFIFRYVYPCFIFLLILIQSVLIVIDFMYCKERELVSLFFFSLIIPVQYVLGYLYLRKNHFDNIYLDIHKSQSDENSIYSHLPKNRSIVIIIVCLTIVLTAASGVLYGFGYSPKGIHILWEKFGHHWLIYMGLTLHWLYNWCILVTNLFIFIYVFLKHLKDLKALNERLEELIWKIDQFQLGLLSRDIIGLRFTLNQSIDNLQEFYTSMTLLGALGIGAVVEYKVIDIYSLAYITIYGSLQLAFLYIIYQLSQNRQNIMKTLKTPALVFKYLTKVNSISNMRDLNDKGITLENVKGQYASTHCPLTYDQIQGIRGRSRIVNNISNISDIDNNNSIIGNNNNSDMDNNKININKNDNVNSDSIIFSLNGTINGSSQPIICNPDLKNQNSDGDLFESHQNNLIDLSNSDFNSNETRLENNNIIKMEGGYLGLNSPADVELLALAYKDDARSDWQMINNFLSEEWVEFTLMGISFSDSEVIKKSAGLISMVIVGSSFINSLTIA